MSADTESRPRVLVLGGNRGMVAAVQSVRRAGFWCAVADDLPFPYAFDAADAGVRCGVGDVDGLERAIDELGGVDGVVATNEAGVMSVAALAERRGLRGLPRAVAARIASKLGQREAANSRCPQWAVPFEIVGSAVDVVRVGEAIGWPLVLKPDLSGGGSRGVSVVADAGDAARGYAFAAEAAGGSAVLAERALDGPQFSAEVLIAEGRTEVVAIGRKRKSREPYRVDLAVIYPSGLTPDEYGAAVSMIRDVTAALELHDTAAHIEFAMTAQGPRPIETGARVGGGFTSVLVAASTGCDPLVQCCRIACGLTVEWPAPVDHSRPRGGAVYRFMSYPPGRAVSCTIPDAVAGDPHVLDVSMFLPAGGEIRPLQWTSQRVGMMAVTGPDAASALARADTLAQRVTLTYEDGAVRGPLADA